MNKLQNILVPIDLTSSSLRLLQQGIHLAKWDHATLHVMHVVDRSSLGHFEATHGPQDVSRLEGQARKQMDELVAKAGHPELKVEQSVVVGRPAECIMQRAVDCGADLILLSAHDSSKKRLGRVAADVVRHAKCKVLIAREGHPGKFRRVAACVDFSDLSLDVLRQAVLVAANDAAPLELVHVIYPIDRDFDVYKLDFGTEDKETYRARAETLLNEQIENFTTPVQEDLAGIDFSKTILESTDPSVSITAHLRSSDIDLVVLGTTGHESLFGLRFGSNAERLIHDTHCSVLTIKPE